MEEIWRDVKDYEGLYQVSNLGRVKSLNYRHTGKEQILKPSKNAKGYLRVCLCKNKIYKNYTIHRLVARTFIDNPNNYSEINHIDENKENNNLNNIEWCNNKYNINYGTRNKRASESRIKSIFCLETNKIYNSTKQASIELKISQSNIYYVLNGRYKQAKGYTFRYANQVLYTGGK